MTNSRGDWGVINPITKVVEDKKKKNDRNKMKKELKKYKGVDLN